MRILIVDDDRAICDYLAEFISKLSGPDSAYETLTACNGGDAVGLIRKRAVDLIISDVGLPDVSGIEISKQARSVKPGIPVVLISGQEEIIQSINSIDLNIIDFLTKPIDIGKLAEVVRMAGSRAREGKQGLVNRIKSTTEEYIKIDDPEIEDLYLASKGQLLNYGVFSDKMEALFNKVRKIHDFPQIPLLITGETGTGKEVLARYSHFGNPSITGPFIGFNCSNLSRELFESELFGYEKGAFTGSAPGGKDGKIKMAEKGTLFLDEVGEIPVEMQSKLLRVIEEREYFKLGSVKKETVNARLVFATNRDIPSLVKQGRFREDLYFRINICEVKMPPLRERKEEIGPLAVFFAMQIGEETGRMVKKLETAAIRLLEEYSFPGNIRELKNIFTKAMLFGDSDAVTAAQISEFLTFPEKSPAAAGIDPDNLCLPDRPFSLDELSRSIVKKTLEKFNGNKTKTAEYLGLSRIQMYYRFKDLDGKEAKK